MAVKTFAELRADMPPNTVGAISGTDILNLTDTVENRLNLVSQAVSVMEFGATGLGDSVDDTAAIQAAIDTGRPVFFPQPPVFYKITASLVSRGDARDGQKIFGLDSYRTTIQMTGATAADVNKPIFIIGGRRKQLSGLYLLYWPQPTAAQTNAVAIQTDSLMWSIIEDINIYRCNTGIAIAQAGFTGNAGTMNWLFSCTIRDIFIGAPTLYGMYLKTVNSTSTGNVMQNIYVNGFTDGGNGTTDKNTLQYGIYMEEHDSTIVDTINVEHCRISEDALAVIAVRCFTGRAIHMEGVVLMGWGATIGSFGNGSVSPGKATIIGWDCIWSQFLAANTTKCGLVQVTNHCELTVHNFIERNNTVEAGANATIVHSWDTFTKTGNSSIRFVESRFATIPTIGTVTNSATTGEVPIRPVIKQVNERVFYPTQANLADLSSGELYVDTAAANVIKRKA